MDSVAEINASPALVAVSSTTKSSDITKTKERDLELLKELLIVLRSVTEVDIYIDKVEASYNEDSGTAGTWPGFATVAEPLRLGHNKAGSITFLGELTRPAQWTSALSFADVGTDVDEEEAAQGEGFGSSKGSARSITARKDRRVRMGGRPLRYL